MNGRWQDGVRWIIGPLTIALVAVFPGCRDKDDTYEIVQLEGKVDKIKVQPGGTGEITVVYYSEKHGQEMLGTGIVTKETEIMINGVVAKLEDVREGEQVHGEVRVEKKAGEKKQIALKIYIDRETPVGSADE